ncbi:hypothetical protein [Parasediminibacterium sp. JCM 36343]|uniref:hypothetical protein n=1 Tax=Parasediminibacterium sp. JCM 36343 TaxID=3374279 RepID=UPI0039798C63
MTILILSISIAIVTCYTGFVSIQKDSQNKKLQTICTSIITLALTSSITIYSWNKDKKNETENASLNASVSRTEKTAHDIRYNDSLRFNKIDSLLKYKNLKLQGDSILLTTNNVIYKNSFHVESKNQSGGQTAFEISNNK